jgi:hypothetical protein
LSAARRICLSACLPVCLKEEEEEYEEEEEAAADERRGGKRGRGEGRGEEGWMSFLEAIPCTGLGWLIVVEKKGWKGMDGEERKGDDGHGRKPSLLRLAVVRWQGRRVRWAMWGERCACGQ